jgi:hypothetical protein
MTAVYTKNSQVEKLSILKASNSEAQESFTAKCTILRQVLFPTPLESTSSN